MTSEFWPTYDRSKKNIPEEKYYCEGDLSHLCKYYLDYNDWDVVHDELSEWMGKEIDHRYQGKQYVLIMLPRGHLKSCVVTKGWAIQQVLRNPNVRILIANAIWDNARGFVQTIMHYFNDGGKLSRLYGSFFPESKNKLGLSWTTDAITIRQRTVPQDAATITSTGVERTQASQHYDIIILDDVVVRENISTKEQRDKVKRFFSDCLDLLEPKGILVVVGTTWHHDDLYSAIPSDDSEFRGLLHDPDFKVFKRIAEQGTPDSVIFKKKFSYDELMKIKAKKGIYEYSSQYLLNPYPEEDQTFKKTWIRYWRWPDEQSQVTKTLPIGGMYVAMTLDPSMGKDKSDHAALVTCGVDGQRNKYVIEAKRFKRKMEDIPDEVLKSVRQLRSRGINVNIFGLESFGFQQALLKPIQTTLRSAGLNVPCELLPGLAKHATKEDRILGIVAPFGAHEVFLHQSQKELMDEMAHFNPLQRNRIDDLLDALAWNKLYWDRIPHQVTRTDTPYGSLDWWMKHSSVPCETDLFSEYRTSKVS